MTIPKTNEFSLLLSSLTLIEPTSKNDFSIIEAVNRERAITELGIRQEESAISLWYRNDAGIKFDSLIDKLEKTFTYHSHPNNREIILIILCIYSMIKKDVEQAVDVLNDVLSKITSVDVSQFHITSADAIEGFTIEYDNFIVGKLNSDRLSYRCKKADSDYYEKYSNRLDGNFAVERKFFISSVINWTQLIDLKTYTPTHDLAARLVTGYFFSISKLLFESFWDDFVKDQQLFNATKGYFLDPYQVLLISTYHSSVTIFLNIGHEQHGFISPSGGTEIVLGGLNQAIPEIKNELLLDYSFSGFDTKNKVHNYLKLYTLYISKAKRHLYHGRYEESFLSFMVALELLLGEKGQSTKSITEKASLLTHNQCNRSYTDQKKVLEKLYDIRSKYVHEGSKIDETQIHPLDKITQLVLRVLFELQKPTNSPDIFSLKKWFKEIQFSISCIETNREVSCEEYRRIGVCCQD